MKFITKEKFNELPRELSLSELVDLGFEKSPLNGKFPNREIGIKGSIRRGIYFVKPTNIGWKDPIYKKQELENER